MQETKSTVKSTRWSRRQLGTLLSVQSVNGATHGLREEANMCVVDGKQHHSNVSECKLPKTTKSPKTAKTKPNKQHPWVQRLAISVGTTQSASMTATEKDVHWLTVNLRTNLAAFLHKVFGNKSSGSANLLLRLLA